MLVIVASSGVILGADNASAVDVDYVKLTDSAASTNRGRQWSLKSYTVNFSRYHPDTGDLINPNGYNNSSTTCSRAYATAPWLASPNQPKAAGIPIAAPDYDGNTLSQRGSCSNRYTDGGTNSRSWLPSSYLNWTLPGSVPGFGAVYVNSSVTAACNDDTQLRGGPAPLVSRLEITSGDFSLLTDQAYGSGGIFSTFWGSGPPSGADNHVRLYSYGTGLIRNQFTITPEQYEYVENGNEIKIYAMGDDWIRLYVNGTQVGTTNTSGEVIETDDIRHLLNLGTNIIAIQVHDKALWRENNHVAATTGVCYNLTVTVPKQTSVTPHVSIGSTSGSIVMPGEDTVAEANVTNGGGRAGLINWERRVWRETDGNQVYSPGDSSYQYDSGTDDSVPISDWDMSDWTNSTPDSSGQICTSLEIESANGSQTVVTTPRAVACVAIGKFPQTQISGSDVAVRGAGSQVSTVVRSIDSGRFGSWAEYSIFAAGPVYSVSGAALPAAGYYGIGLSDRTPLTFANNLSPAGMFVDPGLDLPFGGELGRDNGVWRNWETRNLTTTNLNNLSTIQSDKINERVSGSLNLAISGSSWSNVSNSYVVYTRGNITINSSIRYASGPYSSLASLPQLILIAEGDIIIAEGVENVDAWLIAGGTLSTCGNFRTPYYADLDSNTCDDQLHINGQIQVNKIQLRRTAGAEGTTTSSRARPAEVINGRSDAYLWAYGKASQSQSIRTDNVRELPPRF